MKLNKCTAIIRHQLDQSPIFLALWAGTFSFISYLCMYMVRKPFTAGTFSDQSYWGIDLKIWLIIAQVLGYALSKFIGIRVISTLNPKRRLLFFCLLMVLATSSLGIYYLVPLPYAIVFFFLNGIPLGMIWGIVFSYLEGRKITEVLTAVLSSNFIISSGFAKSLGSYLVASGIDENAMPFFCALLFLPIAMVSFYLLSLTPAPDNKDQLLRVERKPMNKKDRKWIIKKHGIALLLFTLTYVFLTIIRDISDNFAVEIWSATGIHNNRSIYTLTELPVAIILLIGLALIYRIKDNDTALKTIYTMMFFCIGILLVSTYLFDSGYLNPTFWMIVSGSALFIPYILFNGILFDRYIASFRFNGNTGFFMYTADAFGYLASAFIMLSKNITDASADWLSYYIKISYAGGVILSVVLCITLLHLYHKLKNKETIVSFT
ncbi:MAG TPA: DUF5690 family protein [Saprospiraceae bacterium]|nr:DUF5690 family protein [Saprospiraceae bacterium]